MTYIEKADEFKALLSQRLKPKRYIHSLNVADSARYLAKKYSADEDKAYIAGLLHDITKNENDENQLKIIENSGIILSRTELCNKKLLHQISGAAYVKEQLSIDDEEILGAIRYHTTGKAGMTLLEKIIYIADYISAERDYKDVDIMRSLAEQSLEKAALYSLKYSIRNLIDKSFIVHEDSLSFYNELIMQKVTVERTDIMTEKELAMEIVKVLDKRKGMDIKAIHITDFSIIADYFVIVTGTSNTHVKSLADDVEFELAQMGVKPDHIEGRATGWILLDYSSVLVHIFTGESRDYYNLERLWSDAQQIDLSDIIEE